MNGGRRAGTGSTNVVKQVECPPVNLFLQVLITGRLQNLQHAILPSVKVSTDAYGEILTNHCKSQNLPISRPTREAKIKYHLLNQVPQRR